MIRYTPKGRFIRLYFPEKPSREDLWQFILSDTLDWLSPELMDADELEEYRTQHLDSYDDPECWDEATAFTDHHY